MMQEMQNKLAQLITSVAKVPTQIVLAYSGGVDSEVLAHGLSEFAHQHPEHEYLLVHVHHGLSANAGNWAKHCLVRAGVYQLKCVVENVELKLGARISIEAAAREARYKAIYRLMHSQSILLTAHHEDDQLETILLALKRGLGPKGLSAMGELQAFKQDCTLIRPLLTVSKLEIEAYAKEQELPHINDESNLDTSFDRNFLRQEIIPKLKSRWSAIATTASRSAALCAEQQAVLDDEVAQKLPSILIESKFSFIPVIDLAVLSTYSSSWQALLLRGFIAQYELAIPAKVQLNEILYQLLQAKGDAQISLQFGQLLVRRYRGLGYFSKIDEKVNFTGVEQLLLTKLNTQSNRTSGQKSACLRLPASGEQISVHFGYKGAERCAPHNRDKGREFKKLLQEHGVPPWIRPNLPVILYNGRLACVPELWIEKAFLAQIEEVGIDFVGLTNFKQN